MAQEIGDNGLIDTWASGGTIVEPDSTKKNTGWTLGEKPPHEFMNFLQSEFGKQINYLMRSGVPAHNIATPYLAGNLATQSGALWVALANNSNSVPSDGNTNWRKVVTVADLPDASETVRGLIEHATQAEVNAGSAVNAAVTPPKLRFGFSVSLTANLGHIKLPSWLGGLIFQWATGVSTTSPDSTQIVSYQIPFPNAVFHCITSTDAGSDNISDLMFQSRSIGLSQVVVVAQAFSGAGSFGGGVTPRIFAIGN